MACSRQVIALASLVRERYLHDVVGFVEDMFDWDTVGYERPHKWQLRALKHISKRKGSLIQYAIVGGNGMGKTVFNAWLIIWMLAVHEDCAVVFTSSKLSRIKETVWNKIQVWLNAFRIPKMFKVGGQMSFWNDAVPAGKMCCRASAFAWTNQRINNSQSRAGGVHGKYNLLLFDEAGTIPASVWTHLFPVLAKGRQGIFIACGNPTQGSAFHAKTLDKDWKVLHVGADHSVKLNRGYVAQQKKAGKAAHQRFVCGNFVKEKDSEYDILFPIVDLERAMRNGVTAVNRTAHDSSPPSTAPTLIGVDVAGYAASGDSSVVVVRQGYSVLHIKSAYMPEDELIDCVMVSIKKYNARTVFVDSVGLSCNFSYRLRSVIEARMAQDGIGIVSVVANSSASDPRKYFNKRSEMYMMFAKWLSHPKASLPKHNVLAQDMQLLTFTLNESARGRCYRLLKKSETVRILGRSPDIADAIAYTFASGLQVLDRKPLSAFWLSGQRTHVSREAFGDSAFGNMYSGVNVTDWASRHG